MPPVSLPTAELGPEYQAPASTEEFWTRDYPFVLGLVRRLIVDKQAAEDVAMDIFEKLIKRDVPGMYIPETISAHTKSRVKWQSFLSAQVGRYMLGKNEQVGRRAAREPLWCDSAVGEDGTTWLELFGSNGTDEYPCLASDFVPRVRARLAALPPWDGPSLLELFEEVMALVADNKKVSLAFLRKKFHLTAEGAQAALDRLRQEVSLSNQPVHTVEVAGVTLTALEASEAADLLEKAEGNQVRPALKEHKLYAAGTKWYLQVARAELKAYPELKRKKGSHAAGHVTHVKVALVHWLRRAAAGTLATEQQAAAIVTVPSPVEVLEARLWQLSLSAPEVQEVLELARDAYAVRKKVAA